MAKQAITMFLRWKESQLEEPILSSNRKLVIFGVVYLLVIGLFLLVAAVPGGAQVRPSQRDVSVLGTSALNSGAAPDPRSTDRAVTADISAQSTNRTTPQNASAAADSNWHFVVSPFLWFPGVHGTVGALGNGASVHASAVDLLSHFRFGLMGAVEARHKRVVLPVDMMWVRMGENKALPAPNVGASSVDVKASEFILTPKIGFRLVDQKMFKIDALTGLRYWHIGQNLQFDPAGPDFSGSLNWVDPLVGGRIQAALSPKVNVTIAGDVGGWGAASQMDYQVVGLLGYRVKPNWTLQAGYRHLYVNYRSGGPIFDVATSGVMIGVSVALK
jgi:hypothetical protein